MPPGGLPKSPIGGPSGPGGSPMVSPGTGAGMQAAALQKTGKVMETLMECAKAFPPGSPEFGAYSKVIGELNRLMSKKPAGAAAGAATAGPLPVPPAPMGAGIGGAPAPPTGAPPINPGGPDME